MLINRNNIITIDGKAISMLLFKRRLFTGKLNIFGEKTLDYKYIDKELKNNITIIMENEEMYIKYITIPKVKRYKLEKIVRDELRFYYRTDEDITFSYSVLKKNKTNMELIIFYINNKSLNNMVLKNIKNVKAIYLIQFCYVKYVNNISKLSKYVIAFFHKKNIYFVYCEGGLIKYNYIFRNFQESAIEFETCLKYFTNLKKDIVENLQMIYIIGCKEETVSSIKISYSFENLGFIDQNKLFNLTNLA